MESYNKWTPIFERSSSFANILKRMEEQRLSTSSNFEEKSWKKVGDEQQQVRKKNKIVRTLQINVAIGFQLFGRDQENVIGTCFVFYTPSFIQTWAFSYKKKWRNFVEVIEILRQPNKNENTENQITREIQFLRPHQFLCTPNQ